MHRTLGVCAAAMLLSSCGSEREGTIETEDGDVAYSVDSDDGGVSTEITGPDGERVSVRSGTDAEVELPDGFAIYPGADIVTSTVLNQSDGMGTIVVFTSKDSVDELTSYYRAQAEAAGVTIASEIKASGSNIIAGEGEGGLTFSFNASPNGDVTTGQLAVGKEL